MSIIFRTGPFQGWSVQVFTTYEGANLASVLLEVATPGSSAGMRSALLVFKATTPGADVVFPAVRDIVRGDGPPAYERILTWIVEANRAALDRRTDIPDHQREHWQAIVDRADTSRADWFARYPVGSRPAFEIVSRWDYVDGELVPAGGYR